MGRIPNSQKKSLADSGREVGEEQPCTSEQAAERESEEVSTESVKKLIDNNNNFQLEESGVDDDDKLSVVTTLSSSSLESLNSLVAVKQHSSTSRSSSPPAITLQKLIQITCSRLANADIVPSTSYAKRCINTPMESSLVFLSLLRDKSYQLFIEDDMTRQSEYNKAQVLIKHRITEFEGHDATLPQVVAAYVEKMYLNFRQWLKYLNELPGFDQIPRCDINVLMKQNFITIYGLFCSKLFINGEYYHVLPGGIIFSRKWIEKVFGLELTDWSFDYQKDLKKLALSDSEMSLFLPYIFTNPYSNSLSLKYKLIHLTCCYSIDEDELTKRAEIKKINEFYHRALLNEFSLNRRTKQFQANVKKVQANLTKCIRKIYNNCSFFVCV